MEYQIRDVLDELKTIVQDKSKNRWMDINEVVFYSSLSLSTIRRAVARGTLKASRVTGKLLFKTEWVDKWLVG